LCVIGARLIFLVSSGSNRIYKHSVHIFGCCGAFMKKYQLIILGLAMSTLTDCSDSFKTFSTYELNPLKEAFVGNNIHAYLEYTVEGKNVEKKDSITLDLNGNIESKINKGWWSSKEYFKYDSLSRVTQANYENCVVDFEKFTYESFPKKGLLVMNTWSIKEKKDNWVLIEKKLLEFDNDLKKILRKTEINYTDDTTTTEYEYEYKDKKILREIKDGKTNTEYIYQDDKLIEIKRLLEVMDKYGSFYMTDYISRQTGLIDSTVEKRLTTRTVTYYKYYPK